MTVDDEAAALLKRWNAQQTQMQGMNPNPGGISDDGMNVGTDQSPHLFKEGAVPTSPDQTPSDPVNSVRQMDFSIKKTGPAIPREGMAVGQKAPVITPVTSGVNTPDGMGGVPTPAQTPDVCKQCGTMHPPIPAGQKCPVASVASNPDEVGGLDDTAVNKHIVEMRNIIMAQLSSKEIKDGKKFFQYAVIELVKALEAYNE